MQQSTLIQRFFHSISSSCCLRKAFQRPEKLSASLTEFGGADNSHLISNTGIYLNISAIQKSACQRFQKVEWGITKQRKCGLMPQKEEVISTHIEEILNDIRSYIRIFAASASRSLASVIINSYEKAVVYSRLDGKTTQKEIETETGIPKQTINGWVSSFSNAGLVAVSNNHSKNYKALFTLSELEIDVANLKKKRNISAKVMENE